VSDDAAGAYDAATGVWTIGAIADGATATINITARVTATGTTANDAVIGSFDQVDPNSANDSSQAVITVADAADLEVTVTGSNDDPNVDETITVSVTVTNHGPDAAATVALANIFPSVLTLVSDDSAGAYDPATGIWTIGSIPADGSVTLVFTAMAATVGSSADDASATTTTYEADLTNNADTWPVQVHPTSDLSLTKTADEAIPHNGTDITYTITVHNDGPNGATGVVVADLLPAGLTYLSDDAVGAYDDVTGDWTVGALADGADATIRITATVTTTGPIVNSGEVTASDSFDPDSTPANGESTEDDHAAATVNGQATIDLSVTDTLRVVTGAPGAPLAGDVNLGGTVEFTLVVTNDGPDAATGVMTQFDLSAGLAYVSDDSGGAYDPEDGTWSIGTLAAGGSVTIHLTATVVGTGAQTGDAEVMSAFEWDVDSEPANDVATEDDQAVAPVIVPQAAALTLAKTVPAASVERGDEVVFTLSVHNDGPDTARNVIVVDSLPVGMTFISSDGGAAFDAGTKTWTVASIADGDTARLHLTVEVTKVGTLENVARITGADLFNTNAGGTLAIAQAEVRVLSGPDDDQESTNLDPGLPFVFVGLALLAALSFLGWGILRRHARRLRQVDR
jgi:uncharacterized repeat protein (TIGR01451 family)